MPPFPPTSCPLISQNRAASPSLPIKRALGRLTLSNPANRLMIRPSASSLVNPPPLAYPLTANTLPAQAAAGAAACCVLTKLGLEEAIDMDDRARAAGAAAARRAVRTRALRNIVTGEE